ncbi:MAG: putative Ig domain-containing protein [Proteobacteria bacterium]|nr:putative Ig domain-containing protein [Pseudomonadota bacterium]
MGWTSDMKLARNAFLALVSSLVIISCGGGGSGGTTSPPAVTAPSGLSYTTPQTLTVNKAITALQPTVTGTVTSYSVSPALPAGLTLNTTSGAISGTPTAVTAQATYTVTATNSGGNTTAAIVITVNDVAPVASYSSGRIALAENLPVTTLTPASTGGAVVSWSISPALPAGLTFSNSDGTISGTPTATSAAKTYTVTATNSAGDTKITFSLSVESGKLLDLGHVKRIVATEYDGTHTLSVDSGGHWVLWNAATKAEVTSGDTACSQDANECPFNHIAEMAGGSFVLKTPAGFEFRSFTDGHVLSTITAAFSTDYSWWQLASDGSYVVAGGLGGLKAWSPTGTAIFTKAAADYRSGVAFAAPGEIRIAKGPAAGPQAVETITLPAGASAISSNFNGTFAAWFSDGARFITYTSTSIVIYSKTAVQQDITTGTGSALGGTGNWFWNNGGSRLDIYQVGASTTPKASFTVVYPQIIVSGTTLGLVGQTSAPFGIVDLSGATPVETNPTLPAGLATGSSYAATDATHWFLGNQSGVLMNGTGAPATVSLFNYGRVTSVAGSPTRFAVSTASGRIVFFDSTTLAIEDTIASLSAQLQISSDGTVLASRESDVIVYSLPSKTVTKDFNPSLAGEIALSLDGTVIAQSGGQSGVGHQVTSSDGASLIYSDTTGKGQVRLAPGSGNPFATNSTPLLSDNAESVQIFNGTTLTGAIDGYAVGWIDASHLLVNTYKLANQSGVQFVSAAIFSPTGTKIADSPLPELAGLQPLAADSIYAQDLNEIISPTTGAVSWMAPLPNSKLGAVAGSSVVFVSGTSLVALSR